jgi:HD-GYP domain-containing protein (c-di-GMP phosphodiesterase class II)
MDKKKQMQFNLNNFLLATSQALDFVKSEISNTSVNHSKRVSYLALKLAQRFELSNEELSDLCSYCLVHSIALIEQKEFTQNYYDRCNELAHELPFLTKQGDILKYQNEFYDGSGPFTLKDDEIPLFSKILAFACTLDSKFDLSQKEIENRKEIVKYVNENKNVLFDKNLCDIFIEESKNISFWLELQNENEILYFIFSNLEDFTKAMDFEDVLQITSIFTEIFDGDVQILHYCFAMANYYEFEHKDIYALLVASSLKNIGKFMIKNEILNKSTNLDKDDYEQIKAYPFYTRRVLKNIIGFNDIAVWSSKVQEKIDKSGYPFGLMAKDLSLKDRLLICLNIYDALRREKKYRKSFNHNDAINEMKKIRGIDTNVIEDINRVCE